MVELDRFSSYYKLKKEDSLQGLKPRLHRYLVERLEAEGVSAARAEQKTLERTTETLIEAYIQEHNLAVNRLDRTRLVRDMLDELVGYGPLEGLLKDDSVSDILVNGPDEIYVERHGRRERTGLSFVDERHVLRVLQRMLAPSGRRLDESNPMVDARLPDGSRINAIIAPLALDGPDISIRKARRERMEAADLLSMGSLNPEMLDFLRLAVEVRCNILVSGGTGAGKTTLLNVLSQFIQNDHRVILVEDAAELQLGHPHVVRLETRPPNSEGKGEVTARDIVRNILRMRPDRIVLGEVRHVEVMDLLQAMNTGHDGSMSTLHANNSSDALARLEMLAGFSGFKGSEETLRRMITTAIDLIIHVSRVAGGRRKVTSIMELLDSRDGNYVTNELYRYDPAADRYVRPSARPEGHKLAGRSIAGGML